MAVGLGRAIVDHLMRGSRGTKLGSWKLIPSSLCEVPDFERMYSGCFLLIEGKSLAAGGGVRVELGQTGRPQRHRLQVPRSGTFYHAVPFILIMYQLVQHGWNPEMDACARPFCTEYIGGRHSTNSVISRSI
jgi:hypothetical protein